jgi:hypothetical protein
MELDILLRGQSNAFLLAADTGQAIAQEVQRLLGFDGTTNQVWLQADWSTPGAQTVIASSSLVGDWLTPVGPGQWQPTALEQGLLRFASQHQGFDSTAVLWLHNEYDSFNPSLDAATWESAVRADAALLRQALGLAAAQSPYMFVSAIPFEGANDATAQAIRLGMEHLAADPGFNAAIAGRAQDVDMTFRFAAEGPNSHVYGGDHISAEDANLLAHRIALSLAQQWAGHALPGSPVALAGGAIANLGPQVVAASQLDANTLALTLAPDIATGLQPLGADAARGLGWSVHGADGQVVPADQASITGTEALTLHFASALPSGGTLFYGHGSGRLAVDGDHPGQGNAVYDSAGLPAWTAASGVAIAAGGVGTTGTGISGTGISSTGTVASSPAPAVDWYALGQAQLDWFSQTGGWWGGPQDSLLAWEAASHAAPAAPAPTAETATPDWNALAATVQANLAATGQWYL